MICTEERDNAALDRFAHAAFERIIEEGDISTMFQPIISLKSGEVFGYESLTRGPKGAYENPLKLFEAAREMGNLWELELLCRSRALETFARYNLNKKIFLNVDPDIIYSEQFKAGFTRELLTEYGILPENVVFEVTERKSIENMAGFKNIIRHYKDQGYKIAIDDAGAGYSGLNLITDIHPHFIKLDMQLVRDIDKIGLKYALVKNLNEFCNVTGIKLIAEGVETEDELRALIDIGVDLGQGFLFQRPRKLISGISAKVKDQIEGMNRKKSDIYGSNCSSIKVSDISIRSLCIPSAMPGSEVKEIFTASPALFGLPVVDDDKVQGLVMKDKFFMQLGTQYGYSLYSKRPVKLIMDKMPLVIDWDTSLEIASRIITARNNDCIYDIAIITKENRYYGTVTVKDILNKTMEIEINHAKHLNPLTGLPGNVLIERQLEAVIGKQLGFTMLYIDIDNFKAYNDFYGFESGDRVLLYLKNVLQKSIMELSLSEHCFVGHIGGDDFVIMVFDDTRTPALSESIIRNFSTERNHFYNMEDQQKGYIMTKNRHGIEESFGLMTISIAGLALGAGECRNVGEFTEQVSKIKKACKAEGGNCSIIRSCCAENQG